MRLRAKALIALGVLLVIGVLVAGALMLPSFLSWLLKADNKDYPPTFTGEEANLCFQAAYPPIYHHLLAHEDYEPESFRVLFFLAGRAAILRLRCKNGVEPDRDSVRHNLRHAFDNNGWLMATGREKEASHLEGTFRDLLHASEDEFSQDDLFYSHEQLEGDWHFAMEHTCRVFVSDDGTTIIAYCHMGW